MNDAAKVIRIPLTECLTFIFEIKLVEERSDAVRARLTGQQK